MSTIPKRTLGHTGLEVGTLGFGGAPLGDLFEEVSNDCAQSTLQAAWDAGIRYYDTSPFYGYGKSEHRIGHLFWQNTARILARRLLAMNRTRTSGAQDG